MSGYNNLERMYPEFNNPVRCENGCGAVVPLLETLDSYKRTTDQYGDERPMWICRCCAAEEGYIGEEEDAPDDAPVCERKPKVKLR